MSFVFGVKRDYEITGTLNGDPCIIPKDPRNHGFVEAFGFRYGVVAKDADRYLAFPFLVKHGSYLVAIYSNSDSHAAGTSQVMIRSDDGGDTWSSVLFYDNDTGTFDTSLLDSVLAEGESIVLKVYTATKSGGSISVSTTSTVVEGADTYALWSVPKDSGGGVLYRTGYKTPLTGGTKVALFESSDNGITWTYKSEIASDVSLLFTEADIVNTTGTTWIAVIREDSGTGNNLYEAKSTDNGATWLPYSLLDGASGRQPNLQKTNGGAIILLTGRRSGSSGFTPDGFQVTHSAPTTGVYASRRSNDGLSWSSGIRLCPMFSTDGGQPMAQEVSNDRLLTLFYSRKSRDSKPVIGKAVYDIEGI